MSWTNLSLGHNWPAGEWPEYVEVDHDDGRGGRPVRYVSERTCRVVTMDMAGEPPYRDGDWILNELSDGCSECGYPFDTPNRGTPSYCPNCGARVVTGNAEE